MANLGVLLKQEIARISRREIRAQVEPVRKASAAQRRHIAALRDQVRTLERQVALLGKARARAASPDPAAGGKPLRFVAKGLHTLRTRLGLSAADLGRLMGVSGQTIYNWEGKKTVPNKAQVAVLARLRSLGKREVQAQLEQLDAPAKGKRTRKK